MRRPLVLVLLLAAAQAVPACLFLRPRTTPYPTGAVFPVIEDGSVPFSGKPARRILTRDGKIYLSTRTDFVWCIDIASRKEVWKFKTNNHLLEPPFPGAENIYARDEADVLYCLSPGGELLWKRAIGEKILTPVAEGGGRVFFGTDKGKLWSLSPDGKSERVFQAGGPVAFGPVVSGSRVVFGSSDGTLHVHETGGRPLWTFRAPGKVVGPIGSDGKLIFFSTADRRFYCWRIGGTRPQWKVRLDGLAAAAPFVLENKLYVLASNSVLYCLSRSGGDVVWWANVPSRTPFDLTVVEDKLIVASLSPVVLAFSAKTGRKTGEFLAGPDLMANAAWVDPYVLIVQHDITSDEGKLVVLKKQVQVLMSTQKVSPFSAGEEIPFSVTTLGFFEPMYEFYVKTGDKREIIQKASEKDSWTWYAQTEGRYTVGVTVTDAKQSVDAELRFAIEKRAEAKNGPVTLTSQKNSPQPVGEEIPFSVAVAGFTGPRYEFYIKTGETREVVQKASETNTWTWHPSAEGSFTIGVTVTDAKQSLEAEVPFVIGKRPEAKNGPVTLTCQMISPQPAGEEIPFSVAVIGLSEPRYEFYIKTGEMREVVQKASETNTWTWHPSAEGSFTIGVTVTDDKQSLEVEVPFVIEKLPEKKPEEVVKKDVPVSLTSQKNSPQPVGEEIPFSVTVAGFTGPRYEFYIKMGERREVVQKASETNTWTWHPSAEGSFTIGVTVTDDKQSVEAEVPFVIEKLPEKKPDEPEKKEPPK